MATVVRTPSQQFRDELLNQRRQREKAKSGEITISLMWNEVCDLDLHVTCPSGQKIYHGAKKSSCGGWLDVDMNVNAPYSREPIENVFWKAAPAGHYKVEVVLFSWREAPHKPVEYRVKLVRGDETTNYEGTVENTGTPVIVCEFDHGDSGEITRKKSNRGAPAPASTTTPEAPAATITPAAPTTSAPKPRAARIPKPRAPKVPKVPKAPKVPKVPKAPKVPKVPKAPKAPRVAKTLATKTTSPKRNPMDGHWLKLIKEALAALPSKGRKGVSRTSLYKYMKENHGTTGTRLNKYIRSLVSRGLLLQTKQSFRLSKAALKEPKPKKPKAKKAKKPKKPKTPKAKTARPKKATPKKAAKRVPSQH